MLEALKREITKQWFWLKKPEAEKAEKVAEEEKPDDEEDENKTTKREN